MRIVVWIRVWALSLMWTMGTSCTSHGLEGSIGETHSLAYNEVRIRKQELSLLVEYLMSSDRGTEKICKLVIDTDGLDLGGGSLELVDQAFLDHVEVHRSTFANDTFPAAESGALTIEEIDFRNQGQATGEFSVTFVGSLSLKGWFAGAIEAPET